MFSEIKDPRENLECGRRGVFPKERVEIPQLEKCAEGMHLSERDTDVRTGSSEKEGGPLNFHLCDKVHHH